MSQKNVETEGERERESEGESEGEGENESEGEGEGEKSNVLYNDIVEFSTFQIIDIFFFDLSCFDIYFSTFFF
jgi:hypothetical protein